MEFASRSADRTSLAWRAALVFAACVAAGLSFAPKNAKQAKSRVPLRQVSLTVAEGEPSANEPSAYQVRLKEEVPQLLAQGGCPGWIALAG